ncbi:putative Zn-dependent protease [Acinetobacter baumannii]|nr:putative Zn-dependent protease [Acinetobacter baumannii]
MRLTSLLLGMAFAFSNFQANANLATPLHTQVQQKNVQHLTYKIAEVDPRFGLSQEQLIQITQQAADIWKEGTGKNYFTYDPNAKLEIRLVYTMTAKIVQQSVKKSLLSSNKTNNV